MPPRPETRRATRFGLWGSVLVALVVIAAVIRYVTRERVPIRTAKVSYQDLVNPISTLGKVEPINDFQPHAQAAGVIEQIFVNVDQHVNPGQLLLRMDDADAKARLASAESSLQAAELAQSDITRGGSQDERNTFTSDLNRARLQRQQDATALASLQALQQKGAASTAEINAVQQRIQLDDTNIHSIELHSTQRYGQADRAGASAKIADAQAAVAAARSALANVNIRSPIAGTVYSIPYSEYDYVSPSADEPALIYVADLNHIKVTAWFDEPEVGSLAAGQPVKIVWDAKREKVWHGHITIAPTSIIAYNTRNVGECEITVDDAHGDLPPSANVTVTVTTAEHHHVLTVPREALHAEGNQTFVFRIVHDKLVRTPVTISGGIVNTTRAEITSGLSEGDTVALNATTNRDLTDGLEVKPVE